MPVAHSLGVGEILVVYDTTVLRGNKHDLDDPTLVAIRNLRGELGYRLAIPEVVVQEAMRQQKSHLRNLLNTAKDSTGKIASTVGYKPSEFVHLKKIEQAIADFPAYFRKLMQSLHDEVLPLPNPTVEALMERDLENKRPFGRAPGKGLRDYLIWLSILEAKQKYGSRIVYVSANSKDFALDGKLAPEYVEDLRN